MGGGDGLPDVAPAALVVLTFDHAGRGRDRRLARAGAAGRPPGDDVAGIIRAWLEELGVRVRAGQEVVEVLYPAAGGSRLLVGQRRGDPVRRGRARHRRLAPVHLAELAGADGGAVVTGSTVAGLWCAGDIAFAHTAAAGRRLRVEHLGEALAHGAIAGAAIAGRESAWAQAPGFWTTIGRRTLNQAAWGDGWDETRLDAVDGGFMAWYGRDGVWASSPTAATTFMSAGASSWSRGRRGPRPRCESIRGR